MTSNVGSKEERCNSSSGVIVDGNDAGSGGSNSSISEVGAAAPVYKSDEGDISGGIASTQQEPTDDCMYDSSSDTPPNDVASDGMVTSLDTAPMRPPLAIPAPGAVVETMSGPARSVTASGDLSARMVLTEDVQVASEYHKASAPESGGDMGSVVSMPVGPVRPESSEPTRTYSDSSTVASAPAVVVGAELGDVDLPDDLFNSPDGQSTIAERSPGGRYIRFGEKLGSGASKDVYRAYDTQEGIEVAWNVVNLSGVPKTERNRIVNEVRLLERLHHHNIISFHGSWVNRERQEVNFVTEILSSGTLKSFIKKVQVIRWKIAKRWAIQILKGLEYLHSQDPPVIHRDLKCENIFINGTSGDLRIGDLGLSTVHRNGKVLSVLGTPEFMAPDMYEENSYDEKVDIYAFGMCLLEIFTKEIPYSECSNPAQIYKKVTRGDPPESLSRLKSRHAREFIELCLGYRDDDGNFVRPTAADLLTHDFLLKRPTDENEVEVDPPLQERVIRESSTESFAAISTGRTPSAKSKKRSGASNVVPPGVSGNPSDSSPRAKYVRSSSLEEDESDRFDEMPDSEVNIRKVKVMIGRGQELMDDDDDEEPTESDQKMVSTTRSNEMSDDTEIKLKAQSDINVNPPAAAVEEPVVTPQSQAEPEFQYLVSAAVIPNQSDDSRPYDDEILKLEVTLPVDGLTRNVQFDFHLVEDDPVQVAKEMITELRIPPEAVLEISETISGLARAARMKQDKYVSRLKQAQQNQSMPQHPPTSGHSASHSSSSDMQQRIAVPQQNMNQTHDYHGQMMQSGNHSPMPDYGNGQQQPPSQSMTGLGQPMMQQQQQPPSQGLQEQSLPIQAGQSSSLNSVISEQMQPQHANNQGNDFQTTQQSDGNGQNAFSLSSVPMNSQPQYDYHNPHNEGSGQGVSMTFNQAPPHQMSHNQTEFLNLGNAEMNAQHNQGYGQPSHMSMTSQNSGDFQQNVGLPPSPSPFIQQGQAQIPSNISAQGHSDSNSSQQQPYVQSSGQINGSTHNATQHGNLDQKSNFAGRPPIQRRAPPNGVHGIDSTGDIPSSQHQSSSGWSNAKARFVTTNDAPSSVEQGDTNAVYQPSAKSVSSSSKPPLVHGEPNVTRPNRASSIASISGISLDSLPNGSLDGLSVSDDVDSEDDPTAAQLRKLDEDFRKNMMRAKKVFVNRMDNLQRTHHQREAQHQKTLEKHQKERAEFEKRMQQEEIEQNRRIEQLRKEWDRQREAVRLQLPVESGNSPDSTLQNGKQHRSTSSGSTDTSNME